MMSFRVSNDDAFDTARQLSLQEGLLVGISSGATVWSAMEVGKRPEMEGKNIVVIAASAGERYLSTPLGEEAREEVRWINTLNHFEDSLIGFSEILCFQDFADGLRALIR